MTKLAVLALAIAGCTGAQHQIVQNRDSVVRLLGTPAETTIWVDGRFVAPLRNAGGGVALAPGHHQIELRADGYLPQYLEFDTASGSAQDVRFALHPELP